MQRRCAVQKVCSQGKRNLYLWYWGSCLVGKTAVKACKVCVIALQETTTGQKLTDAVLMQAITAGDNCARLLSRQTPFSVRDEVVRPPFQSQTQQGGYRSLGRLFSTFAKQAGVTDIMSRRRVYGDNDADGSKSNPAVTNGDKAFFSNFVIQTIVFSCTVSQQIQCSCSMRCIDNATSNEARLLSFFV